MDSDPLLVPLQLEAFVLNPQVCNTGEDDDHGARIIPITQPNYTFLRLDNFVVQSDVQRQADLHNAAPAETNLRMTDLGVFPPAPRRNRHGVYLHWILPRAYRAGVSSADSASKERHQKERLRRGLEREDPRQEISELNYSTPEFIQPPTRWVVIRQLDLDTISPADAKIYFKEYEAWVVESDYLWKLDDIPLDYDLQVDVSPFVVGIAGDHTNIEQQAEVFIGRKTPLDQWSENPNVEYANISLLRSSNQLFADFQLHNTNVFSILDNFSYTASGSSDPQYLDVAKASYYLLGWHPNHDTDPLWNLDHDITRAERLEALFMALMDTGIPDITNSWLQSTEPTSLCCHGAIYNVRWNHDEKPATVPADDYATQLSFNNQDGPTVSIGTTPMDSLITYCSARQGHEGNTSIKELEEDLLAIDSLLHARDDGVEGQREAKDTIYNWNFTRSQGGTHYFIGGEDRAGKPTQPDGDAIQALIELNQFQLLLDSCQRAAQQYRWEMFSCWWKYVSDVSNKQDDANNREVKDKVIKMAERISKLRDRIKFLQGQIDEFLHPSFLTQVQHAPSRNVLENAKTGTLPFYYRAIDPTVLIGGIESGWPSDYLEKVSVRLPAQVVKPAQPIPVSMSELITLMETMVLPQGLIRAVEVLSAEFYLLIPPADGNESGDPSAGQVYPQFHDQKTVDQRWRDRWSNRQPWFPLFMEWELEYTHIPFEYWSLDEQVARLSDNKMVRYGIQVPSSQPLYRELGSPETHDVRVLSGRVLILPQPSFSLAAKVRQLFQDTPPEILNQYLDPKRRQELLDGVSQLSYLSAPLTGLTEGLLTMAQGTHIKPENKIVTANGSQLTALKAAEFDDAGLTKDNIELIEGNSALTPYAAMVKFLDERHCPFKPVTHGQFRYNTQSHWVAGALF